MSAFTERLEAAYAVIGDIVPRVRFTAPVEPADLETVRALLEAELAPGHKVELLQSRRTPRLVHVRVTEPTGVVIYARNLFVLA